MTNEYPNPNPFHKLRIGTESLDFARDKLRRSAKSQSWSLGYWDFIRHWKIGHWTFNKGYIII